MITNKFKDDGNSRKNSEENVNLLYEMMTENQEDLEAMYQLGVIHYQASGNGVEEAHITRQQWSIGREQQNVVMSKQCITWVRYYTAVLVTFLVIVGGLSTIGRSQH